MAKKSLKRSLTAAKNSKQDEFYTQLSDIEKELRHYSRHFKNKTVLCNCDDPTVSNFFHYFSHNFERLKLKRLIATCYRNADANLFSKHTGDKGAYLEYNGDKNDNRVPDPDEIGIHELNGDGDFRSEESINLLKQADIVVTNPPFSLFREYVDQLVKHKKKFLIIGNQNAITYKEIFALLKENKIWLGYSHPVAFIVPDHYEAREVRSWRDENGTNWRSLGNACWFTNLDIAKRHEDIILFKTYNKKDYPHYDNYDAIEVSRFADIPIDYDGAMGVPITWLDKYNPEQFEILGWTRGIEEFDALPTKRYENAKQVKPDGTVSNGGKVNTGPTLLVKQKPDGTYYTADNAKGFLVQLYMRIVIKRKSDNED
ncbi:adenine-specific methyltransferase EcoRI family protein [Anatilimnocola sp. NA78]|uniref:adenine-specific methyltransferase EcoRI family protein n=1 Tax=Anatilimnocola sp. NA78 TaxID=3415683 RepID=UPI003CE47F98